MPLGSVPEVGLAEARNRHLAGRKLLASGVDPMERRKKQKLAAKPADTGSFASAAPLVGALEGR